MHFQPLFPPSGKGGYDVLKAQKPVWKNRFYCRRHNKKTSVLPSTVLQKNVYGNFTISQNTTKYNKNVQD